MRAFQPEDAKDCALKDDAHPKLRTALRGLQFQRRKNSKTAYNDGSSRSRVCVCVALLDLS